MIPIITVFQALRMIVTVNMCKKKTHIDALSFVLIYVWMLSILPDDRECQYSLEQIAVDRQMQRSVLQLRHTACDR